MVIRSEELEHLSIEDIEELRLNTYNFDLDLAKNWYAGESRRYQQKIEMIKQKFPFIETDVELLSDKQLQALVGWVINTEMAPMRFASEFSKVRQSDFDYQQFCKDLEDELYLLSNEELQKRIKATFPVDPAIEYQRRLAEIEADFKTNYYFSLDMADLHSIRYDDLKRTCEQLLAQGKQVFITVDNSMYEKNNDAPVDYMFSPTDLQRLVDLNNYLAERGMKTPVHINEMNRFVSKDEFGDGWSIHDVVTANQKIDEVVAFIKHKQYSPFEAMLFIHNYITHKFQYKDGRLEECRVLPGIFKSGKIVCSGYASFIKAVIDRLNDPNLKCDLIGCEYYKKGLVRIFDGGHCHNLVHINDPKYSLKGSFVEDATPDSILEGDSASRGFTHCLLPVADLDRMKKLAYVQKFHKSRFDITIMDSSKLKQDYQRPSYLDRFKTSELVLKYSAQSPAIPLDTYRAGLVEMYSKTNELESLPIQLAELKAQQMIMISALRSAEVFTSKAESAFRHYRVTRQMAEEYFPEDFEDIASEEEYIEDAKQVASTQNQADKGGKQ